MSLTSIRLREAWNWGGLSLRELAHRTVKEMKKHETIDRAAMIAFYAMLSLVPFLGLLFAITLGTGGRLAGALLNLSRQVLPAAADAIIRDQVQKFQTSPPVGFLTVSFLVMVWSSSSVFVAVMDGTNAAYGVRDSRSFFRRRLLGIVMAAVESVLLIGAMLLIVVWPSVSDWIGLGGEEAVLAGVVQWAVVLLALLTSFALAYYYAPDVKQEWEWITPGSAVSVLLLILAGLGFRLYFLLAPGFTATYGALGGFIILQLWFYLVALTLLVGAEINCVIERAAPHGRSRGQKEAPQSNPAAEAAG